MTDHRAQGIKLYHDGKYKESLTHLKKAEEDLGVSYYRALCHIQLGQHEAAIPFFREVLSLEDNFLRILQCRILLAYCHALLEQWQESEKVLRELLDQGIESAQVYSLYGYTRWSQGFSIEGIKFLNEALKLDPDNRNAMNSLGYILAEEGQHLTKALELCTKALSADEDNAFYLDSVAWVHHQMGQDSVATLYLRKALTLAPENPVLKEHWVTLAPGREKNRTRG